MIKNLSNSFTRPADTTAYASGDLVANSTTAGSVAAVELRNVHGTPMGEAKVARVGIRKSGAGVTNASFRVHLYSTGTITAANGDNGAWSTNAVASYLGSFDVTVDKAFTDGAAGWATPADILSRVASGQSLYALVEARGAYTPASAEVFTVMVDVLDQVV